METFAPEWEEWIDLNTRLQINHVSKIAGLRFIEAKNWNRSSCIHFKPEKW